MHGLDRDAEFRLHATHTIGCFRRDCIREDGHEPEDGGYGAGGEEQQRGPVFGLFGPGSAGGSGAGRGLHVVAGAEESDDREAFLGGDGDGEEGEDDAGEESEDADCSFEFLGVGG
ncbi:hypothetical protein ACMFMF_008789 [Clarireedia jacksonii]